MLTLISIMLFFSALGLGVEAGPGPYAASLTFMLFLAGYAYLQALKMLLRVHPGEVAYLIVTRARVLALHTSDQHSDAAGGEGSRSASSRDVAYVVIDSPNQRPLTARTVVRFFPANI